MGMDYALFFLNFWTWREEKKLESRKEVERKSELRGEHGEIMECMDEAPVSLIRQVFLMRKRKFSLESQGGSVAIDQECTIYSLWANYSLLPVFVNNFVGTQPRSFVYVLCTAAFVLPWRK